jgi:integrase
VPASENGDLAQNPHVLQGFVAALDGLPYQPATKPATKALGRFNTTEGNMGRIYHMTWVPRRRGWMKEYKGKKYAVSCRQLGAPDTKDGSYQQANEWWQRRRAEIDLQAAPPRPGTTEALSALLAAWKGEPLESVADAGAVLLEMMAHFVDNPIPPVVAQAVLGPARVNQLEAGARVLLETPATQEKSVQAQVERWVSTQRQLVATGNTTPDEADNRRICLQHFRDWVGAAADVSSIDAQRLHGFYCWCLAKVEERHKDKNHKAGWSSDYAKKVFSTARRFVRFLWESGLIELPRNIGSKWRFNGGAKAVKTWTVEEVQHVIQEAPGKLKLALLLMINCGFTQMDVSDLLDTEVDWKRGAITRKRSKTGDWDNVPVVCYRLWPLTFKLLKKYRSGKERVLVTERGRPFVRKEMVNGKLVKADGIRSNYAHLKRRLGFKKALKLLRKTAATLLEGHPIYGRFTAHFLGHSPVSVKDRHYAAPSQELFDEALTWLGRQLGFVK